MAQAQTAGFRDEIARNRDPLGGEAERKAQIKAKRRVEEAARKAAAGRKRHTLRRVCRAFHERVVEPNRSDKHSAQWINSIEQHIEKAA